MSWPYPRPSYTNFNTHQTLLGKSLFEHGDCKTVAAIAASSCSIQNSSLGPNLLALMDLTKANFDLFYQIFLNVLHGRRTSDSSTTSSSSSTLQFTKKLNFSISVTEEQTVSFISAITSSKYFHRSVREIALCHAECMSWFATTEKSRIVGEDEEEEEEKFEEIKKVMTGTKSFSLHLGYFAPINNTALEFSLYFPNLTSLDLPCCRPLSDQGIDYITQNLHHLTSLNICSCDDISNASLLFIGTRLKSTLLSLNISGCSQVTDLGIEHLTTLVKLVDLNLWNCTSITDVGLQKISQNLINLTSLNLKHTIKIQGTGLKDNKFICLRSLCLSRCYAMTDETLVNQVTPLPSSSLTSLDLSWLEKITDESIVHFASLDLVNLRSLDLKKCSKITDHGLEQIVLGCCELTNLDLSWCHFLTDQAVEHVTSNCTKMSNLSIAFCHQIKDSSLKLTGLKLGFLTRLNVAGLDVSIDAKNDLKLRIRGLVILPAW